MNRVIIALTYALTAETPPTTRSTNPTDIMSSMPWLLPAAISGGVVAVIVIIILILVCCCCCYYQRIKRSDHMYILDDTTPPKG